MCEYSEHLTFITGVWCVWLYCRESMWAWPIGVVNCLFQGIVCLDARLYAEFGEMVIFLILTLHGWAVWLWGGTDRTEKPMTRGVSLASYTLLLLLSAATCGCMGWILVNYSDATKGTPQYIVYLDALVFGLSLAAQWLLNIRKLENWLLWIVVDVFTVGIFLVKERPIMAALYLIYLVMAARGFLLWKAKLGSLAAAAATERGPAKEPATTT